MVDINEDYRGTPIAQSMSAKIQLGLRNTVGKLSNKMRYIDQIAPKLVKGGVVNKCKKLTPFTIKATGIATGHRTIDSFGGILYGAAAVRQDIYIEEGTIYKTRQESTVDVDEIDYLDTSQRLKYYDIINSYTLLEELMEERDKPDLVILDIPLLLERSDVPLESRYSTVKDFKRARDKVKDFWSKYQEEIYPFNPEGTKIVSIGSKRFGAVLLAIADDSLDYIVDQIAPETVELLQKNKENLRKIGLQRMLKGVLGPLKRTAAFQFDGISSRNRFEPKELRDLGLMGYHFKAGIRTNHLLVELIGGVDNWDKEAIDDLTDQLISLMIYDQPGTIPLPLWYATHGLKPLKKRPGILEFYKRQAKELLRNNDLEEQWLEGENVFDDNEGLDI
ncbi:hypothetical protein MWH25_10990 [Natroniella acetigena]|uniref:hypothetical protein n=1 Tax=Natroniella acetigena TaxID=52004 RepID=UPI00200B29D8|nr:hypothetical protein [Natroniella acetigena]MCK8828258.1 hypothetical protein [Natroniella acetigena]